jgi:alginate O-acetyltransferase complex protein AlgI
MVQLYFDFLGYTHIARGASLLFNIELPLNFNHPLNATNIANFWQRWQISLSRWLHDYVFRPLGGARRSLPKTMINVFVTLLIAGIWHGAGWPFVMFGVYFGVVVALYHAFRRVRKFILGPRERRITEHVAYRIVMTALTFVGIAIGSVFFRSPDLQVQLTIFEHLTRLDALLKSVWASTSSGDLTFVGLCGIMLLSLLSGPIVVRLYSASCKPLPYWLKWQAATVAMVVCWIFCAQGQVPFIYFQF